MSVKVKTFVVEGAGLFPFDMLRYDGHHTISAAAALFQWHKAIGASPNGIGEDEDLKPAERPIRPLEDILADEEAGSMKARADG